MDILDTKEIIERIKQVYNIKTDIQLANQLEISLTTISHWRKGERKIDLYFIFSQLSNINSNYILYSIGDKYIQNVSNIKINKENIKEIENLKRENEELREKLKNYENVDNTFIELRAKNEVMADLLERLVGHKK